MICVKINSNWLKATKRQAQRGRRTSSGKTPCTTSLVKKLVWVDIPHSLASHQKSCPRRPTHFLTKQPKCCTCLMRPFLAGCTSDWRSTMSNNANRCLITSLYTQAHISLHYCASLLCERREDSLLPRDDVPFPNSHALYNPVKEPFQVTKNMLMQAWLLTVPWMLPPPTWQGTTGMLFTWWPRGDCQGSSERALGKASCREQAIQFSSL